MTRAALAETGDGESLPVRPLATRQKVALAIGAGAMSVATTINYVVMTPLARASGLTEAQVGGILAISTLFYAITNPLWARASNGFGRKPIIVLSLAAAALTNIAFTFALGATLAALVTGISAFLLLTGVRSMFGLFSAGIMPASMAAMIEATTPRDRAAGLGMVTTAISAGYVIGPVGSALLVPLGPLAPLWGVVVLLAASALWLQLALPHETGVPGRDARPTPLRLRDRRIRPYLLFLFIYFLFVVNIQATMAWLVQDRYALTDIDEALRRTGLVFASHAIAMLSVQFGYLLRRKPNPRRMLPLGLAVLAVAHVASAFAGSFWILLSCFFLAGMGAALIVPALYALGSMAVEKTEEGAAAAALSAAPPWALVAAPMLGALLYGRHALAPLLGSACVMILLCGYALHLGRRARASMDAADG